MDFHKGGNKYINIQEKILISVLFFPPMGKIFPQKNFESQGVENMGKTRKLDFFNAKLEKMKFFSNDRK